MRGHLKQRSKGSWTIWLDAGTDPESGKRKQLVRTVRGTKKEAEAEMARLIARDPGGADPFPKRITLRDYSNRWLEHQEQRLRPRTLERYRSLLERHVLQLIGSVELTRLRPAHIQAVVDRMLEGGSAPRTVVQARAVIGSALEQALKWELIAANPVKAVQRPKPGRPRLSVPSSEQLAAIIDEAKSDTLWGIPILLAATTGARRSEILGLTWKAVDLDKGKIRITQTLQKGEHGRGVMVGDPKTARARREISLLPFIVSELRRHRQRQLQRRLTIGSAWQSLDVVSDRGDGFWLTPDAFSDAFKRIAAQLGLDPRTRLHDLRHAVATTLLAEGVHPAIASAVLGHSSPAFTMSVYQHVTDGMTDQAAVALGRALELG